MLGASPSASDLSEGVSSGVLNEPLLEVEEEVPAGVPAEVPTGGGCKEAMIGFFHRGIRMKNPYYSTEEDLDGGLVKLNLEINRINTAQGHVRHVFGGDSVGGGEGGDR